jgi:transcriptional regulator with XRE-family HTH domain
MSLLCVDVNGLGRLIRRYRGDRTQAEVAEAAGISRSYLSELETGRHRRPPRHIVERLADALDMDVAILLTATDHPVDAGDIAEPRADFVSFVMSEPTLAGPEARSAVLAVYHAVATDPPRR